jgi:tyrosyl-tRNA synthetase
MEFMYPLMQAYDSVALKADVELGGTDQKFNLLVARTVQERYAQAPQVCLIMPLLRGTDGEQKMSKSYDNYVGITEAPEEQFGKTMSIPDALLPEWIGLATAWPAETVREITDLATRDPYAAKRRLAARIVNEYHGENAAREAEAHFDRLFLERAAPDEMPEVTVSIRDDALRSRFGERFSLPALLVATKLAASNSEAARLIEHGAIRVDGERVTDRAATISIAVGAAVVLQRGKRLFVRVLAGA